MSYSETTIQPTDNEQIKELKRKILSLQAQLELQKNRSHSLSGGDLLKTEAIDFYPGEQLDFILSILRQVQKKCAPDSRAYDIITSILSLNKPIGHGEEILIELKRIFKKVNPEQNLIFQIWRRSASPIPRAKSTPNFGFTISTCS